MLLAFVDESDHGDFRCFRAILADENAKQLTDQLNALMIQASKDYGIPATTGSMLAPMFHGKGVGGCWSTCPGEPAREGHRRYRGADVTLLLRHVSETSAGSTGSAWLPGPVPTRAGLLPAHSATCRMSRQGRGRTRL